MNCEMFTTGPSGGSQAGIIFYNTSHSTIKNTNITNTLYNSGISDSNNGILFGASSQFNNISSNNILVSGNGSVGATGINLESTLAENNTISSNVIFANGTTNSGSNVGILVSPGENTTVTYNNITTTGTIGNAGIQMSVGRGAYIGFNNISTNGTNDNTGISITAANTTIISNIINANGTGERNKGILLAGSGGISNNSVLSNTIVTGGSTDNPGISLTTGSENLISGNNVTTLSSYSAAIIFESSADNNTLLNNFFSSKSVYISTQDSGPIPLGGNMTNTTFVGENSSIRFPGEIEIDGRSNLTINSLNITNNKVFLNSTPEDIFNIN